MAKIESDGKLLGRIYIHLGDDSEFVAERAEGATGARSRSTKANAGSKNAAPAPTEPESRRLERNRTRDKLGKPSAKKR